MLWHMRPLGPDETDEEGETDDKLCGVFSSAEQADRARRQLVQLEGFRDYPDDFRVDAIPVGELLWESGSWSAPGRIPEAMTRLIAARIKDTSVGANVGTVFLLWHMRPLEGQENLDPEMDYIETDDKLCGGFTTRDRAEAALQQLTEFEGFRDYPEAFLIDEYDVDNVQWDTGFVSLGPDD